MPAPALRRPFPVGGLLRGLWGTAAAVAALCLWSQASLAQAVGRNPHFFPGEIPEVATSEAG
ncbi:MAG: hypothetical protein ACKOFW_18725, partial [Planctomycetaceae bacterium]